MSTPTEGTQNTEMQTKLQELTRNYLHGATWTLGGALRFDSSVTTMVNFFRTFFPQRTIERVAGVPACTWSLDWFVQRRPMALAEYTERLEQYAKMNTGVVLVFDNPYLNADMTDDVYALRAVEELYNRDRVRKNAVSVASDALADELRRRWPKLPIYCHANRLVSEQNKRTPALYNKLAEKYDRVCLHPTDATRPAIYTGIAAPAKFDVVINDPCFRTCPVRREHVKLLAEMRRSPYDVRLMSQREALITRNGCHRINPTELQQKLTCNLSRIEANTLHDAGFRSFIIQASQFRNEMTVLWDLFRSMLDYAPEISNKAALIASSAMAQFGMPSTDMPSGLKRFSFTNYE